jgi:hypothetical protein
LLFVSSLFMVACNKDNVGVPEITAIRSTDPAKADSTFTTSLPGAWIVIEGKNFTGLRAIYVNEKEVYVNSSFVTDGSIVLLIPSDAPTLAIQPDVSNTIRLVTATGEVSYNFTLMINPPSVYGLSNEMAVAGDKLYITGTNFYVVDSIIFPGGVKVSSGFEVSEGATLITLTVPEGITTGGPVVVKNIFGRALSPSDFNSKTGMLCNFDDKNTYIWGSTVIGDATSYPGANGQFNVLKKDNVGPSTWDWWANGMCCATNSSSWMTPEEMNDNIASWAVKFELYVAKPWNSGFLLLNPNSSVWDYTYRLAPWLVDGERTIYQPSGWNTVTIPLNLFRTKGANGDGTGDPAISIGNLINPDGTATLDIVFINDTHQGIASKLLNVDFGIDNLRVVKLTR